MLNILNLSVFLLNLLFKGFNIFDDCEIMIFSHVDHMIDIFDLLVHVN